MFERHLYFSLLTIKFHIYLYDQACYLCYPSVFSFSYLISYFSSRYWLKSSIMMVLRSFRFCLYNSNMVANPTEICDHYIFLVDYIFKKVKYELSLPLFVLFGPEFYFCYICFYFFGSIYVVCLFPYLYFHSF